MKMSKNKIRNAHCIYYEGQTGLCKAKEFVKCNPVNCKLYTIDELSTILDLQEQLNHKEQECEELKENNYNLNMSMYQYRSTQKENDRYKQALDEIEEITGGTYYETEQTVKFKMQDIQDIINKAKGDE